MATVTSEFGVKFTLTGPDGSVATFNDSTDPNYVGVLTNIEGLDSAEVRESGDVIVAFDGGVQGPNYWGRRPVIIEGLIYNHTTRGARATKIDRLVRASTAMRGDSVLSWTPSDEGTPVPVELAVRRQQPLRVTGGWNKTFQLSLVAADPRIYAQAAGIAFAGPGGLGAVISGPNAENEGTATTYPVIYVGGDSSADPLYVRRTNAQGEIADMIFVGAAFGQTKVLAIDTLARTITLCDRVIRKNHFTTPSFESATSALTGITGTTFATNTTPTVAAPYGTKAGRFTAASAQTSMGASTASILTIDDDTPVGANITVAWSSLAATTTRTMRVTLTWLNNSDVVQGSPVVFTGAANSTSAWTRQVVNTDRTTSNCTKLQAKFELVPSSGNTTIGEVHYIDGVVIENPVANSLAADGSYFDGNSTDTGLIDYQWAGTTDNSLSYAFYTTPNPAGAASTRYSWLDHANSEWYGMDPGENSFALMTTPPTVIHPSAGGGIAVQWKNAWL